MSEHDQSFLKKSISRRGLLKAAGEGAKVIGAGLIANELNKSGFSLLSKKPDEVVQPTLPPLETPEPISAVVPTLQPTASPSPLNEASVSISPEKSKFNPERANAIASFKAHMKYYPGLLDDNPELKKIVEDPNLNLNENQFKMTQQEDGKIRYYLFKFDPRPDPSWPSDIRFVKYESHPESDMLMVEFSIDEGGKIIPDLGSSPKPISNQRLIELMSKMTQFSPKDWSNRTRFENGKELDDGITGSNDEGIPKTFVQVRPDGHATFSLYTNKENENAPLPREESPI